MGGIAFIGTKWAVLIKYSLRPQRLERNFLDMEIGESLGKLF